MLVLTRRDQQWTTITDRLSGRTLRFQITDLTGGPGGSLRLAFDDPARDFDIVRDEARVQGKKGVSQ